MPQPRVALVTCAALPDLDPDDRLVIAPLAELGVRAVPAIWDDAAIDWAGFDLVVLRDPWDYVARRDEFVAWARSVPRLLNPASVVEWNTHKGYLRELAAAGVPVVPTRWLEPGDRFDPPEGAFVVKPAISAGSKDTGLYREVDADLAAAHVERLLAAGRTVMVQPYLAAVEGAGESALLYFDSPDGLRFSHAARKGPMLSGPDRGVEGLYVEEQISARAPSEAELAVGARAIAAAPPGLLYARVDLIAGADDAPVLIELELTEPSLFLAVSDDAAAGFARAIASRL
ncbi:MAG: hypothetical protein WA006_05375 [Rhodoglobus sp.]